MNKAFDLIKKIAGTLFLPVLMYVAMMIFCYANGKTYFGTWVMWRTLLVDIAVSVSCAMGIGLQFKNGRFDFSGGSIMLLSAIVAGNIARNSGNNIWLFVGICMLGCVVLSVIVALVHVWGRLPIKIATLGMALLYEAGTCLIFNGNGINLTANMTLKKLSSYPLVLIPLGGAIAVYAAYSYLSKSGKQSVLLSNNQQAAVNIGINENKNVVISYIFSGMIFGFATMIYTSTALRSASYTSLSTVGELFSNILPVFIGLYIGVFCGDTIGIIMGAISICLMRFGLSAVLEAEMGSAVSTAMTGIFVFVVNFVGGQGGNVLRNIRERIPLPKKKAA